MMKLINAKSVSLTLSAVLFASSAQAYLSVQPLLIPCPFDASKTCTLQRDILNDKTSTGLKYYAATNYDHRISGEINVYDATLVMPYTDAVNAPGQLKLLGNKINPGFWKAGEIMTRQNLDQPPYNSPVKSAPWTTKEITHGYLEVVVKMPKCDTSDDGLCQSNNNPVDYSRGLWPAIWLEPTMDANWPQNGEIDIAEAYLQNTNFNVGTAALHFNGNSPRCGNGDCVFIGYNLGNSTTSDLLYNSFHKWGFEWQPDPNAAGGVIITGYFDNVKVWGPLTSASLPADGPGAISRGFNDPAGGYYLIVNLAVGGGYAGTPNAHMQNASMYIQSVKAYNVGGEPPPPPMDCLPPANIQYMYSADKKQVTLAWQEPANSEAVQSYEVHDWQNRLMWKGTSKEQHCFTDHTLPGVPGTYIYFLYTNCTTKQSPAVQYNVRISS